MHGVITSIGAHHLLYMWFLTVRVCGIDLISLIISNVFGPLYTLTIALQVQDDAPRQIVVADTSITNEVCVVCVQLLYFLE